MIRRVIAGTACIVIAVLALTVAVQGYEEYADCLHHMFPAKCDAHPPADQSASIPSMTIVGRRSVSSALSGQTRIITATAYSCRTIPRALPAWDDHVQQQEAKYLLPGFQHAMRMPQ
jgi:hypothetical protein